MMFGAQQRPEGCLTDLKFDAWLAGELDADARAAVEAHLSACARCGELGAVLSAEHSAYLALHPHAELRVARPARVRALRWPVPAALLSAAAAVVVAFFAQPAADPSGVKERRKGGASIGFFVGRAGRFERGHWGQSVRPDDRIRFTYTSDRPAYLAILARDAAGTVSVYFPAGDVAHYVSEGYDAPLDSSVALDATLGPESVFALFCDHAFDLTKPQQMLAAARTLSPQRGCELVRLSWTKEATP
jgi:hypothetical protein